MDPITILAGLRAAWGFLQRFWQPLVGAAVAVALIAVYQHQRAAAEARGEARVRAQWSAANAAAEKKARADEARREAEYARTLKETNDEAQQNRDAATRRSRADRANADSLRGQLAALSDRAASAPGQTACTLSAGAAVRGLADLAGQCVGQYIELAAAARSAYEAGKACERQYDKVIDIVGQ